MSLSKVEVEIDLPSAQKQKKEKEAKERQQKIEEKKSLNSVAKIREKTKQILATFLDEETEENIDAAIEKLNKEQGMNFVSQLLRMILFSTGAKDEIEASVVLNYFENRLVKASLDRKEVDFMLLLLPPIWFHDRNEVIAEVLLSGESYNSDSVTTKQIETMKQMCASVVKAQT